MTGSGRRLTPGAAIARVPLRSNFIRRQPQVDTSDLTQTGLTSGRLPASNLEQPGNDR